MVIEYVGVAHVEVDDGPGVVTFDRVVDGELEQHLLLDHVLPLVLARQGQLVLHGALISLDGVGVVILGSSGAGKSTMTGYAMQHGWTVGGDDGAVVHQAPRARAEPTYSTIRLTPAAGDLLGIDLTAAPPVVGKRRVVDTDRFSFSGDVVDLDVVVVLERSSTAGFRPLGGIDAHVRLFSSTFHADLATRSALPSVVDRLALLVETTKVAVLSVPAGREGLGEAERCLRRVVSGTSRP